MVVNPLAHLSKLNADVDVRRKRRNLPAEQFAQLIEATRKNGDVYGMSAADRVMLCLTAAYTGLRASELASLTPACTPKAKAFPETTPKR